MEIREDKQSDRNTQHEQRYMMSAGTNLMPECLTKYLLKILFVNKNVLTIKRLKLVSDWLTVQAAGLGRRGTLNHLEYILGKMVPVLEIS